MTRCHLSSLALPRWVRSIAAHRRERALPCSTPNDDELLKKDEPNLLVRRKPNPLRIWDCIELSETNVRAILGAQCSLRPSSLSGVDRVISERTGRGHSGLFGVFWRESPLADHGEGSKEHTCKLCFCE